MESSSEVLFLSFYPNYDTWFWQKRMTHPGKNATEASVTMIAWWPGISKTFDILLENVRIVK